MGKRRAEHAGDGGSIHPKQPGELAKRRSAPCLGVFDCASNQLAGFIEVNLARLVEPGQVNISYGVFPQWRRQGLALRAINLMRDYLRTATEASQMVLRIAPENAASLKLAEKAGFTFCGLFDEPEGRMARYLRDI